MCPTTGLYPPLISLPVCSLLRVGREKRAKSGKEGPSECPSFYPGTHQPRFSQPEGAFFESFLGKLWKGAQELTQWISLVEVRCLHRLEFQKSLKANLLIKPFIPYKNTDTSCTTALASLLVDFLSGSAIQLNK